MEQKRRYTLGKKDRLKSRKEIELLFKEGASLSIFPLRVLYILKKDQISLEGNLQSTAIFRLQAGFTASSRHFKKAVDRNRVKRLMRESWRLQKNELQLLVESNKYILTLFIIYVGKELPEYKSVYEKTSVVLKRLIKLTSENR
ncbi:MAG: ribonuclease P protein component [Ferruginibacter sp.]|nr:ribonuclease P protein component [Ferruginibacter sp.]